MIRSGMVKGISMVGLMAAFAFPLIGADLDSKAQVADMAATMAAELTNAFEPIHARYGYPDSLVLVAGSRDKKLRVLPDLEAIRFIDAEKASSAAELVELRKKRDAEVANFSASVNAEVEKKRADAERRIRALNNLANDRKNQFDLDEKAIRDKLDGLNEQVLQKMQQLKAVNLELAVTRNDLVALRKDALEVRTELAGERNRLAGARRERAFIEDESQKKAIQLDQINQLLTGGR